MVNIGFWINILDALSVGDILLCIIPSLLPSQNDYLEVYKNDKDSSIGELKNA